MEKLAQDNHRHDFIGENSEESKRNHYKKTRHLTMPIPNSKRSRAHSDSIDIIGSASNFLGGVSYVPVSVCFPPNDVIHRIKAHD